MAYSHFQMTLNDLGVHFNNIRNLCESKYIGKILHLYAATYELSKNIGMGLQF